MKGKIHFFVLLSLILFFYNVQFGYTENAGPGVTPAAGESVENKTSVTAEPAPAITPQAAPQAAPQTTPQAAPQETGKHEPGVEQPEGKPPAPSEKEIQQVIPPVPQTTPQTVPQKPVNVPQQPKAPATISFFFDDADIFEVAQTIFADVLKVNYIIDPQVKGRVNFRTVNPIPRDEVLSVMEIILRLNGIGFVEEAGIYRIIPLAQVSKELIYSQIGKSPEKVAINMFTFKNMDLKEAMPDIENVLGLHIKEGNVRIVPIFRMNSLIVVASSKEYLDYVGKWVDAFDSMFSTARPKIFVYALQNSKAPHIASLLQSILTGTPPPATTTTTSTSQAPRAEAGRTAGPQSSTPAQAPRSGAAVTATGGGSFVAADTRVFADDITNSLIILATPADFAFIEETVKKIDIMPRQVVIEGLIARVDLTDNLSFGISWSLKTDVKFQPFNNDINLDGIIGVNQGGLDTKQLPSRGFTFVGTDPKGVVRAVLTALAEESKAKVLAAPHILVSDNREARIQVGRQVPIATSTTSTPTTVSNDLTSTSTIQYKDIGIILKVKPQVNDSGLVSLEITQEISSLGDTVKVAGLDEITINKTEATTDLVAQDGDTIIIGGLIQEDVTKFKDGIPFLSKIPLIGNLFGNTSDKTTRTELIILLTPHVMRSQQEAGNVTSGYLDRFKASTKDKSVDNFIMERSQGKSGADEGSSNAK